MMRPIMITDRRVTTHLTADVLAGFEFKRCPLFIFRGCCNGMAVYVFGRRIFAKGWL